MLSRVGYLLPFAYFWSTRLRNGSIGFHVAFEWLAAAVVVVALADPYPLVALWTSALAYIAFISLYEIGYMANDLFAARAEQGGRLRGPQDAARGWILLWVVVRVAAFLGITWGLGLAHQPVWWSYHGALAVVFAFHNGLDDRELKAGTFLWLSWFRFMAPVLVAVPTQFLPGIGLACAMAYSAFRQFGYLDSKGLLRMPGRKRPLFRWAFFMWPLLLVPAMWWVPDAKGFVILALYYAAAASLGAAVMVLRTERGTSA